MTTKLETVSIRAMLAPFRTLDEKEYSSSAVRARRTETYTFEAE
jgi:hypothetical protein